MLYHTAFEYQAIKNDTLKKKSFRHDDTFFIAGFSRQETGKTQKQHSKQLITKTKSLCPSYSRRINIFLSFLFLFLLSDNSASA